MISCFKMAPPIMNQMNLTWRHPRRSWYSASATEARWLFSGGSSCRHSSHPRQSKKPFTAQIDLSENTSGHEHKQWRIQDSSEEGAPTPKVGAPTYYLVKNFAKTAWKWKNLDPEWRARILGAPLRSANDKNLIIWRTKHETNLDKVFLEKYLCRGS